jgi:phenylalanyl-tRNA synthetase beta subunit
MCVIADGRAVLGFGGILGGEDTGCTHATKNVLIECAYFDPLRTAATGRKTGIVSDARYRFERGVDPAFILPGLDLATALMMEVAGGTPSKRKVAGAPPETKTVISFQPSLIEKLAGIELEEKQIRATLQALGFAIEGKGATVKVTAPSWRPDIHGAADLVEEVVRIVGLDRCRRRRCRARWRRARRAHRDPAPRAASTVHLRDPRQARGQPRIHRGPPRAPDTRGSPEPRSVDAGNRVVALRPWR